MTKEANPILTEVGLHFSEQDGLYDQAEYLRDILRAVGSDHLPWIGGDFGDTSSIDRDNDAYRALGETLNAYATPGDLNNAIEALDFLISLRPA